MSTDPYAVSLLRHLRRTIDRTVWRFQILDSSGFTDHVFEGVIVVLDEKVRAEGPRAPGLTDEELERLVTAIGMTWAAGEEILDAAATDDEPAAANRETIH